MIKKNRSKEEDNQASTSLLSGNTIPLRYSDFCFRLQRGVLPVLRDKHREYKFDKKDENHDRKSRHYRRRVGVQVIENQ